MMIPIDDQIRFEVIFDPLDREPGFADDIRFTIHEQGPTNLRMLAADTTSILLTPDQAEQLAQALWVAAQASRQLPSSPA